MADAWNGQLLTGGPECEGRVLQPLWWFAVGADADWPLGTRIACDCEPRVLGWDAFTSWVVLPQRPARTPSPLPRLVKELRHSSGLSQRDLATILGTSHTTVRKLEVDGRVTAKSREAAARVAPVHDVVQRLAAAFGGDPSSVAAALNTEVRGKRAVDLLREGSYSRAYLNALRAFAGPRQDLLAPDRGSVEDATVELR